MENPYEPPSYELRSADWPICKKIVTAALWLVGMGILVLLVAIISGPPAALVFCICVTICSLLVIRQNRKFNEKYPPIDDKEFIRRCRPGVNVEIALRVRRILSDSLGIDYDRIYPEQSFVKDLDC